VRRFWGRGRRWLKRPNCATTRRCTRPPPVWFFCSVSALLKVGRNWAAAGELGRCVAARGLDGSAAVFGLSSLKLAGVSRKLAGRQSFSLGLRWYRFVGEAIVLGFMSAQLSGSGAAFGFLRSAVWSLWRGFWFSGSDTFRLWRGSFGGAAGGARKSSTATQQGAAPDRLQLRSFLTPLPAAGELSRCAAALAFPRGSRSTPVAGRWSLRAQLGVVGVLVGAASWLWRGVWASAGKMYQQQHNQALHPTARSVVVFPAFRLRSNLVVTGGRRVSLALCCKRAAFL